MNKIDGGSFRRVELDQPKQLIKPETLKTNNESANVNFGSKLAELSFTGAAMAARFQREPEPPPSTPTSVTTPLQTDGEDTETTYTIGEPTRPDIQHDNGFLQNPDDPNDPNPIPTIEPTEENIDYYESELNRVTWAQRADDVPFNIPFVDDDTAKGLEDGIEAYRHFLEGNGEDREFSYEEFVDEDEAGEIILNNAIADAQQGAEEMYDQIIAENPELAGQTITFDITGGVITVGGSEEFPYPQTENWQKAIGGHSIWSSATVTVTPPSTPGGEPTFSMDYTLHAEDRYNFNPGQADIATGEPDENRGETLELTGLAHQYTQYATVEREVTWTEGDIQDTTEISDDDGGR